MQQINLCIYQKHFQVTSKTADEYMSLHRLNEEEAELTGKDVGSSAFMLEEINCQKRAAL